MTRYAAFAGGRLGRRSHNPVSPRNRWTSHRRPVALSAGLRASGPTSSVPRHGLDILSLARLTPGMPELDRERVDRLAFIRRFGTAFVVRLVSMMTAIRP